MKCPYCNSQEHKVTDKRETPDGLSTRRRRECLQCTKRFTTYERVEEVEIIVIKRDGTRVPFDRRKVLEGVQQACHKRPVSYEKMQEIVQKVETTLLNRDAVEFDSRKVGDIVMRELKKVDKVAYIRFASVYKSFKDVEEFEEELQKLLKK